MRTMRVSFESCLLAGLVFLACTGPAGAARRWRDQTDAGLAFRDARLRSPLELDLEGEATVPAALPFDFRYFGRVYDHARATADGRVLLSFLGGSERVLGDAGFESERWTPPRDDEIEFAVFEGVTPQPGARILFDANADRVVLRWVGFGTRPGESLVFEAHLSADSTVRYQYLQMGPYLRGGGYGRIGTIAVPGGAAGESLQVMSAGVPEPGFFLSSGGVIEFPGRPIGEFPQPAAVECPPSWGLPPDALSWCDTAVSGPDRIPGTIDDNLVP